MAVDTGQPLAPQPDDYALMEGIADGDAGALETLYDRHSPAVFALCARVVGDRAEAEDVLIDVFGQLWTRRAQFDATRGSPLAYLMTVARSRALDHRRGQRAVRGVGEAGDRPASSAAACDSVAPDRRLVAAEEAQRLRTALARLDEPQRRAIELSFLDGLSHAQIAERLGRPLGTVKTTIRQGLIQLRRLVAGAGEGASR